MPLTIQSPKQSNWVEYLMITLMGLVGFLRILDLRFSVLWIPLMVIFGVILLYAYVSAKKIVGQTTIFHDDGTIIITDRKGRILKTASVSDYSGVASGWGLKSQYSWGFSVALTPKDIFAPVLTVYANKHRSTVRLPETEDVARVRQQISNKTSLENYGFLGAMHFDDEWRLLVKYPNNRNYPK